MRKPLIRFTYRRGADVPSARLNEDKVREIRRRYWHQGESQASLARELGVAQATVHAVISGRSWGHVR